MPNDVRKEAHRAIEMMKSGAKGGTPTGWNRARQLAFAEKVNLETLKVMRAWFARHGPDATNGGTSYRGYRKFVRSGEPNRGAVAWLLWGGDAAYKWLKTPKVRELLRQAYPKLKEASKENNLISREGEAFEQTKHQLEVEL